MQAVLFGHRDQRRGAGVAGRVVGHRLQRVRAGGDLLGAPTELRPTLSLALVMLTVLPTVAPLAGEVIAIEGGVLHIYGYAGRSRIAGRVERRGGRRVAPIGVTRDVPGTGVGGAGDAA